jgi:hypothetical protein
MTIIMTIIGVVVFFISLATSGFTEAFKRLIKFTAIGVLIDFSLLCLTVFTLCLIAL